MAIRFYTAVICLAMLAQPGVAADAPRFFPLNHGQAVSYVSSGNKFLPLRAGANTTTLQPRVSVASATPQIQAAPTSGFRVERYQPRPHAVFHLRNQPDAAPVQSVRSATVAPLTKDNNGNRELTSNAPYSSSFYGASNIGLTEHTWPVELSAQQRISSGFGMRRHPVTGSNAFHKGVDIAAPTGSAVLASADGVVEETGQDSLIGKYVRLRHPDGSQSLYGHLSAISVKEADWLKRYQPLGAVGSTGRTTGPHLHYALNVDGQAMDPMPYLKQPGREVASR